MEVDSIFVVLQRMWLINETMEGTGTQAGDSREALALSQTFFPDGHEHEARPTMNVGSIKTIIGHTEGGRYKDHAA